MHSGYRFLLFIFLVSITFPSLAQENAQGADASQGDSQTTLWHENLFFDASLLYCVAPDWIGEIVKPEIGFRCAIGYEYSNFREGTFLNKFGGSLRLAIESGCIFMKGNSLLIKEGSIVPLVLKFGYFKPLNTIFGVQADVNLGLAFSQISRYETASDIINNNLKADNNTDLLGGFRLYAAILPLEFLKVYAGGGVDFIFEKSEPIPLLVIEAGVSLKPFIAARVSAERREKVKKEAAENIIFRR